MVFFYLLNLSICFIRNKLEKENENSTYFGLGLKDFLFVGIQLVLFVLYVLEFKLLTINLHDIICSIGLVVSIVGVFVVIIALLQLKTNLSPFPSPKSNATLIKTGLYKFIRHPIYTGIILATFGFAIYMESSYKIIISLGLYLLFYFKSKYEEDRLSNTFPDYKSYKKGAARFFPRFNFR